MNRASGLDVAGTRALVLGLGVTGRSVATALAAHGAEVFASEYRELPDAETETLRAAGVEVESGGHERAADRLGTFDFVVPSPGVSPHGGFLREVVTRGAAVVSELDLAVRLTDADIVAVTGTNGKTTVCLLAEQIARGAGRHVIFCGNTETPFLSAADEHPDADLFVVEASSFGLYFCRTLHPRVALITNLVPDHLDWHSTFDDYRWAKARIAARQRAGDLFCYPHTQPDLAALAPEGPERLAFGATESCAWIDDDEIVVRVGGRVVRAEGARALAERGPHFAMDAAAAAAALVFLGAEAEAVERGLRSFEFARHRLESIGTLNGISVIDDSVATNPHATIAALRSLDRVVLIAGGRNKGLDLTPLATEAKRVKAVVTLGEAAEDIGRVFADTGVITKTVGSMDEAVAVALETARPGDVVLLSPACASHDMFENYADRGRVFREACRAVGVKR